MTLTIDYPEDTRDLHHHYEGQTSPQQVYVEFDLSTSSLKMDYNADIGNAVPIAVWVGDIRRYWLPNIPTTAAAQRLLNDVAQFAQTVRDGATFDHGPDNSRVIFTELAEKAEAEIEALCLDMDETEMLAVWDASEWFPENPPIVERGATDEDLEARVAAFDLDAWGDDVMLVDTEEYLRLLRDDS